MNGKSGEHRPPSARLGLAGVLLVILGLVLLAACSGSPATTSGSSSPSTVYTKALAYAQCMRAHGIPSYPDPNSQGQFIVSNDNTSSLAKVSRATSDAALKACQALEPPSLAQGPPSGSQGSSTTNQGLKFAACMRSHGEPGFPDPAANGSITLPAGMNAESTQFQNAEKDCQSLMPTNPGGSAP
jgi:hypothetical protein